MAPRSWSLDLFYTTVYKNMDGMIMRDFTSWVPALIRTSGFECAAVKSFVSASLPERLGVSTNTTVKVFKIEGIITCTTQSVIHVMKCVCSSVHLEKSRKSRTLNIEVLLEIIRNPVAVHFTEAGVGSTYFAPDRPGNRIQYILDLLVGIMQRFRFTFSLPKIQSAHFHDDQLLTSIIAHCVLVSSVTCAHVSWIWRKKAADYYCYCYCHYFLKK